MSKIRLAVLRWWATTWGKRLIVAALALAILGTSGCIVDRATKGKNSQQTNSDLKQWWEGEYEWVRPAGSAEKPPAKTPTVPGQDDSAAGAVPGIPEPPAGASAHFKVKFKGMSRLTILTVALEEIDNIAKENAQLLTGAGILVLVIGVGLGIYCSAPGIGVLGALVGTALIAYGYSKAFTIGIASISMVLGVVYVIYKLKESADRRVTTVDMSGKVAELEEEVRVLLSMLPAEKAESYTAGRATRAAAIVATKKKRVFSK